MSADIYERLSLLEAQVRYLSERVRPRLGQEGDRRVRRVTY
jgi:hypothetical protein